MISQTALDHFRTNLASKKDDPYSVLLRRNKLPMALLDDAANPNLRKVCEIGTIHYRQLTFFFSLSAHILWKRNHLLRPSGRKPRGNGQDSMSARLRNLVKQGLPLQKRRKM